VHCIELADDAGLTLGKFDIGFGCSDMLFRALWEAGNRPSGRKPSQYDSGSSPGPPQEAEDSMKSFIEKVQRFIVSEDGPTAVEYAVMLALIIIVCITAIRSVGTNANATFEQVGAELG
jgi:pilus assembly protein Flp/PilA